MTNDTRFEPLLRKNLLTLARQYGDAVDHHLMAVDLLGPGLAIQAGDVFAGAVGPAVSQ